MAESSMMSHPPGGRRRKMTGPAVHVPLPDLPPLPRGDDSSDGLEKRRRSDQSLLLLHLGGALGRERSPSNTIVSWELRQLGLSSEELEDRVRTDIKEDLQNGVAHDCTPILTFALVLGKLEENRLESLELQWDCSSRSLLPAHR